MSLKHHTKKTVSLLHLGNNTGHQLLSQSRFLVSLQAVYNYMVIVPTPTKVNSC